MQTNIAVEDLGSQDERSNHQDHAPPTPPATFVTSSWLDIDGWRGSCSLHTELYPDGLDSSFERLESFQIDENRSKPLEKPDGDPIFEIFVDDNDAERECQVPEYVTMLTTLTQSDVRNKQIPSGTRHAYSSPIRIRWLDKAAYQTINDMMQRFIAEQGPDSKRTYLRTSRVSIMERQANRFVEADSCILRTPEHWKRYVPPMVNRFCALGKSPHFYLELHSDFEWFTLEPYETVGRRHHLQEIKQILTDTVLSNFQGHDYWTKQLLNNLFNDSTIHDLVRGRFASDGNTSNDYTRLQLDQAAQKAFADWLIKDRRRPRLLATTIYADFEPELDVLHKLMIENEDIDDASIPLSDSVLKSFLTHGQIGNFRAHQRSFKPQNFSRPGRFRHLDVDGNVLVPVKFDQKDPIGKGAFGSVFKATIHPDFHTFPSINNFFAVKQLNSQALEAARQETKTWQLIAKESHPHITQFFMSWSQNGQFYMLSPLADKSLRKFLEDEDPLNPRTQTDWLLEQLGGLASGIRHIHNIGKIGLRTKVSPDERVDCGYHHDLKPDNILVFPRRVFKISDFGTAKLRQIVSHYARASAVHIPSSAGGDLEYAGPDYDIAQENGQAYDIWSFGCILLEILLWTFGKGKQWKKFRDARKEVCSTCDCSRSPEAVEDYSEYNLGMPNFWFRCWKAGEYHVKTCVQDELRWVREQARTRDYCEPLLPLCDLVQETLRPDPAARPVASTVRDRIKTQRLQAKYHFESLARETGAVGRSDLSVSDNFEIDPTTEVESIRQGRSRAGSPLRGGFRGRKRANSNLVASAPQRVHNGLSAGNSNTLQLPTSRNPSFSADQLRQSLPAVSSWSDDIHVDEGRPTKRLRSDQEVVESEAVTMAVNSVRPSAPHNRPTSPVSLTPAPPSPSRNRPELLLNDSSNLLEIDERLSKGFDDPSLHAKMASKGGR